MAIAHLRISSHSRGRGHTAAAAFAYRGALRLRCPRTGETQDYRRKSDVVYVGIVSAVQTPIATGIEKMVCEIEGVEKRRDAQIAHEIQPALPWELTREDQIHLIERVAMQVSVRYETPVAVFLHAPHRRSDGDHRNVNAHLVLGTRRVDVTTGRYGKKITVLRDKPYSRGEAVWIRTLWETETNAALAEAGKNVRVDLGRRADGDPEPTLGPTRTAIERKGRRRRDHARGHRNPSASTIGADCKKIVDDGGAVTGRGRELARHGSRERRALRETAARAEQHLRAVEKAIGRTRPTCESIQAPEPSVPRTAAIPETVPAPPVVEAPTPSTSHQVATPETVLAPVAIEQPEPAAPTLPTAAEFAFAPIAIRAPKSPAPTLPRVPESVPEAVVVRAPAIVEPYRVETPDEVLGPTRVEVPKLRVPQVPAEPPEINGFPKPPIPAGVRRPGLLTRIRARIRQARDLVSVLLPAYQTVERSLRLLSGLPDPLPPVTEAEQTEVDSWLASDAGGGSLATALQEVLARRLGSWLEDEEWTDDAKRRRATISERLYDPDRHVRVVRHERSAAIAAGLIDEALVRVLLTTIGQAAPRPRPSNTLDTPTDPDVVVWFEMNGRVRRAWTEGLPSLTTKIAAAIRRHEVVALRTERERRGARGPDEGRRR